MRKIRKGDQVAVLSGRDRGKRGVVLRVLGEDKVVVENVNLVKRHTKPDPAQGNPGGIIEREQGMPLCKVAIYNPVTQKPDRVGIRVRDDGSKVRFFKSNNELIDI